MSKNKYCKRHTKLVEFEVVDGKCQRCGKPIKPKLYKQLDIEGKLRKTWKIDPSTQIIGDTEYNREKQKKATHILNQITKHSVNKYENTSY